METLVGSPGLFASAQRHWRHFILAWLFPVFLYVSWIALSLSGLMTPRNELAWLFGLEMPIFFAAGYFAGAPYRRRLVSISHAAFWLVLIPVAIWCALVFVPFWVLWLLR
jgi:hypothetical protein